MSEFLYSWFLSEGPVVRNSMKNSSVVHQWNLSNAVNDRFHLRLLDRSLNRQNKFRSQTSGTLWVMSSNWRDLRPYVPPNPMYKRKD